MRKPIKKIAAICLAVLLAAGAALPAAAADVSGRLAGADVSFFNDAVNAIKTDLPYAVLNYENGVPEGGLRSKEDIFGEGIDENAAKYLITLLEGLFNNNTNLSQAFIRTLFGAEQNTKTTMILKNGAKRDTYVPLYGQSIVSALTPENDFRVETKKQDGAYSAVTMRFFDTTLEEAKKNSIGKVFSLPEGTIDPVIIGKRGSNGSSFLKDVRLQDFRIENAVLTARFNESGKVSYYRSDLDYRFSLSFRDVMSLLSAFSGYNIYIAVIDAINKVRQNLDEDEISADDVLGDQKIDVTYHCGVELDKINWSPRCFGDADGNGVVDAADARLVLRSAVDLEPITNAADCVICDINFDKKIDAADARLVLRTAVNLEPKFSEVPEGKKVVIADLSKLTAPKESDKPADETPGIPTGTPIPGTETQSEPINDLIQSIFDIIDATRSIRDAAAEHEEEPFV